MKKRKKRFFYAFILMLAKAAFKIFYRFKVFGRSHFISGPALLSANHTSYLDPPVVACASPQEIHFLARSSLFNIFFLGKLITCLNTHPLGKSTQDTRVFRLVLDLLSKGYKVLIFPEGERSRDNKLGEIKSGIGFLSWKSKSPIIPIYIHGTFDAWKRAKKFPKLFKKIVCVFGSPIHLDEFKELEKKEAIEAITKKTVERMEGLRAWYENGAHGTPP